MKPFVAKRVGYVADLEPEERAVLAELAEQVCDLVRADVGLKSATMHARWPDPGAALEPDIGPSTGELVAMTDPELWDDVVEPQDPAVRRLLPAASEDDDVAAEFRRFTQTDLAAAKVARLQRLKAVLTPDGRVVVRRQAAQDVAGALTDLRLVLADRLDLRTDEQVEALYDELFEPDLDEASEPPGAASGPPATNGRPSYAAEPSHAAGPSHAAEPGHAAEHRRSTKPEPAAPPMDPDTRRYLVSVFLLAGLLSESLVGEMLRDLRHGRGVR